MKIEGAMPQVRLTKQEAFDLAIFLKTKHLAKFKVYGNQCYIVTTESIEKYIQELNDSASETPKTDTAMMNVLETEMIVVKDLFALVPRSAKYAMLYHQ